MQVIVDKDSSQRGHGSGWDIYEVEIELGPLQMQNTP